MIPPEYLACGPPEGKQNREQFYVALWQGGSLTEVCLLWREPEAIERKE